MGMRRSLLPPSASARSINPPFEARRWERSARGRLRMDCSIQMREGAHLQHARRRRPSEVRRHVVRSRRCRSCTGSFRRTSCPDGACMEGILPNPNGHGHRRRVQPAGQHDSLVMLGVQALPWVQHAAHHRRTSVVRGGQESALLHREDHPPPSAHKPCCWLYLGSETSASPACSSPSGTS